MNCTKRKKALITYVLAALCTTSAIGYAATEHWNDASLTPQAITATPAAESTDWQTCTNDFTKRGQVWCDTKMGLR